MKIVRTELVPNNEHNLKSKELLKEVVSRVVPLYENTYSKEELEKKWKEINEKKRRLKEKKEKLDLILTKSQEVRNKLSQKLEEVVEKNKTLKETILEKLGSKE